MNGSKTEDAGAPLDASGVMEINTAMNYVSGARYAATVRSAAELDALLERIRAGLWEARAAASWLEGPPDETDEARAERRTQYEEAIRRADRALRP